MKPLILLAFAALLQPAMAQTTLLNDDFNRGTSGSPQFFDGSMPTTTGGTATGSTWVNRIGGSSVDTASTNGSELTIGPTQGVKSTYSLQLATSTQGWAANTLYTFSATLPQLAAFSSGAQAEIGFGDGAFAQDSHPIAGVFLASNSAQWDYQSATNVNSFKAITNSSAFNTASGTEFTITFNTATDVENFYIGTAGASGTVDFSMTYSSLPISSDGLYAYVELQDQGAAVGVNNSFSVSDISVTETAVAPEPSSLALFALGGVVLLGLGLRGRRFCGV